MQRQPVNSSSLKSVGHEGSTLEIEFHNGRIYVVPHVSADEAAAFLQAPSIGKHFNDRFRARAKRSDA